MQMFYQGNNTKWLSMCFTCFGTYIISCTSSDGRSEFLPKITQLFTVFGGRQTKVSHEIGFMFNFELCI